MSTPTQDDMTELIELRKTYKSLKQKEQEYSQREAELSKLLQETQQNDTQIPSNPPRPTHPTTSAYIPITRTLFQPKSKVVVSEKYTVMEIQIPNLVLKTLMDFPVLEGLSPVFPPWEKRMISLLKRKGLLDHALGRVLPPVYPQGQIELDLYEMDMRKAGELIKDKMDDMSKERGGWMRRTPELSGVN